MEVFSRAKWSGREREQIGRAEGQRDKRKDDEDDKRNEKLEA
jgi:hypothetical protein